MGRNSTQVAEPEPPHDATPDRDREQCDREDGGNRREEQVPEHEPVHGAVQEGAHAPSVIARRPNVASAPERASTEESHNHDGSFTSRRHRAGGARPQRRRVGRPSSSTRAIERIEKLNGELNAVIHPLLRPGPRRGRSSGLPDGPFTGVPIVVKDLDGTLAGAPYHAGNKALKDANYVATTTSYLFEKLEARRAS